MRLSEKAAILSHKLHDLFSNLRISIDFGLDHKGKEARKTDWHGSDHWSPHTSVHIKPTNTVQKPFLIILDFSGTPIGSSSTPSCSRCPYF